MFPRSLSQYHGSMTLTLFVIMLLASARVPGQGGAPDSKDASKTLYINGRVLADIVSPVHGAGLGPKYRTFIFGWEQAKGQVLPIKVEYAYFGRHSLGEDFFVYTNRYKLSAVREMNCDETVGSLSLMKNIDSSGKELPPTNVLRRLNGTPRGLLRPDTNLECYTVGEGQFKVLPR